jgi:hypothetical protein
MTAAAAQTPAPVTDRRDLAGPALRTFFNIAEKWGLTTDQERRLLGSPARSTYFRWKRDRNGPVPHDVIERISYVIGIYKALQILFTDAAQADAWVKRPNAASLFAGDSALDRMLAGQVSDLFVVRQYLDAQRGWG